ncbi:hypothetical protein A2755_00270 [Candidatus Wolfebacteria bacterium RIFCSPHIGHO2_01_FULL_48_22]|uniref:Uncharacterized protein n=1 Tax=Candidatus Wolfebacteria bacterium RIFCSPHIGHO2_01_FULL_48_22 TaxID=1802555 RepID=A0A1F8DV75_9BACT|nr:MAG: hypothetical protein A2755_00270 [Candidatus Wolfebacteria bacterium RIFCSPHIGHO2_01_FULL_48_22]
MAKKLKSTKTHKGLELAATGVLLAAAAGYYFLYGSKQAKQNRAKIKDWALKAKADVLEQVQKAKVVGEKEFNGILQQVTKKYKKIKQVDPKELNALMQDLKHHWEGIQRDVKKHTDSALKGKRK